MDNDKFCCYGTYNSKLDRCLVICPFSNGCARLKELKTIEKELEEKQNENVENEVLP